MNASLPSELEIDVGAPFDRVYTSDKGKILSSLVPIDKELIDDTKLIPDFINYEMQEICNLVNGFREYLEKPIEVDQKTRIKVLIYCHLMEADFPYVVYWNLLRALSGQENYWTMFETTNKGKKKILEHPGQKIETIQKLSGAFSLRIGDFLDSIWEPDLRNSFSHSQYFCFDGNYMGTRKYSPLSRTVGAKKKHIKYTKEEIDTLYEDASEYFLVFIQIYKLALKEFQDGSKYPIVDGYIRWDKKLSRWFWADN